jgi:hypothetical protein
MYWRHGSRTLAELYVRVVARRGAGPWRLPVTCTPGPPITGSGLNALSMSTDRLELRLLLRFFPRSLELTRPLRRRRRDSVRCLYDPKPALKQIACVSAAHMHGICIAAKQCARISRARVRPPSTTLRVGGVG